MLNIPHIRPKKTKIQFFKKIRKLGVVKSKKVFVISIYNYNHEINRSISLDMLSPYANSAILASRAVKQTYKGLITELYAIHNGQLSEVI